MAEEDEILEETPEVDDEAPEEEKPQARGGSPTARAIRFFQSRGLSKEDAAAFVWNLTQESGKNLQTNMIHDNGTGYGIAGFRDPVPGVGRRSNLFRFAGTKQPDLEQQLAFMWHELNGPENAALRKVLAAQTPEAKAQAAISYFRPAAIYAASRARNAGQVRALINSDPGAMPDPDVIARYQNLPEIPQGGRAPTRITVRPQNAQQEAPDEMVPLEQPPVQPPSSQVAMQVPLGQPAQQLEPIKPPEAEDTTLQQLLALQAPAQSPTPPHIPEELMPPTVNNPGLAYEMGEMQYPTEMPLLPVPASLESSPNEIAAARIARAARPEKGRLEQNATWLAESGILPSLVTAPFSAPLAAALGLIGASPTGIGVSATALPIPAPAKLAALATGMGLDTFGADATAAPRRSKEKLTPEQIKLNRQEAATKKKAAQQAKVAPLAEEYVKSFGDLNRGAEHWWLPAAVMGVATGVALAVPKISKMVTSNSVPRLRTVADAMPNTVSIVRNTDIARSADDALAGPMSILHRSFAPAQAVKEVEALGIQTNAAAHDLINTAAAFGKVKTATHDYVSAVSLNDAMKADSPAVRQALLYQSQKETLLNRARTMQPTEWATYGPPRTPEGHLVGDLNQLLKDLVQADPRVTQAVKDYQHLNKALWNYERGGGTYATINKTEYEDLTKRNRTFIPYDKNTPLLEQNPYQIMLEQMHQKMRSRMHNEMVGRFVNTANQSPLLKNGEQMFTPASPRDISLNERLKPRVLSYKVNGLPTHVTTDEFLAGALERDPMLLSGGLMERTRRGFEMVTTGKYAGWFADTSAIRQWDQAKTTTPVGFKSPSLLGMGYAVPQQSLARMSKYFSEKLHDGWLENILGKTNVDNLGDLLARQYDRSRLAMMQKAGGYEGNAFSYHEQAAQLASMRSAIPRWYDATVGNLIKDIHNSANFNFIARNEGRATVEELIDKGRALTGDPRVRGRIYRNNGTPLTTSGTNYGGLKLAQDYGRIMDFGRHNVPWTNIIQQSMKRTAQSYWQNPGRFVANTYKWSVAPTAAAYMTALGMGKDPNGQSYVDYMLYGRSDLDRIANLYIPKWGAPAHEGWRIPRSQERSVAGPLTEIALDAIVRGMKVPPKVGETTAAMLAGAPYFGSLSEVTRLAAPYYGFAGSAPMPPVANLVLGSQGMNPAFSMLEQSYLRRQEAFSEHPQLPAFMEAMIRAVGSGIADIAGTSAAAYVQSDAGNVAGDLWEALKAGGDRYVQKSVMGRNLTPSQQVPSRYSPINNEYYKRRKEISDLTRFFKSGDSAPEGRGSNTGEVYRQQVMGDKIPLPMVGATPNEPTNPLYKEFMSRLMTTFNKSAVVDAKMQATGAMGFPDMLNHYSRADAHARAVSQVMPSSYTSWRSQMEDPAYATTRDYIKKHGVDPSDPKAVQGFWERERQTAMRKILFVIDKVEDDLSKEAGRPIKLKDLHPYVGGTPTQY